MRVLIAIATLLASSVVGLSGAAPASAVETCPPPTLHGVVVTLLHADGIGCAAAETLAIHTLRHGTPRGWTCMHRTIHHSVGGGLYYLTFVVGCTNSDHARYIVHYHYPR
jgi:hypothetical protein